jgi:diguanylate cyclase (GGDEF)-like protein
MREMQKEGSTLARQGRKSSADSQLLKEIGTTAHRLLSTVSGRRAGRGLKSARPLPLVEETLRAAAEVESYVAAQSARIAYLENLTLTDELTGLCNRRGFFGHLHRTLASANRYGDQGVFVLCDLDRFKAVNDTYGHHVGDEVLRHAAQVLKEHVRETDLVARLGGDEFAVLMVQTSRRDGFKRAQMLDRVLNTTVMDHENQKIPLAASFGVETFGPNDEETNLIARADMAMYVNKRRKASTALSNAAE